MSERSYDISIKLDSFDETAYPLYAKAPAQWRRVQIVHPSYTSSLDSDPRGSIPRDALYVASINYPMGRGTINRGVLEITAMPITSQDLARTLSRYQEIAADTPLVPFGFRPVIEFDDIEQVVKLNPGYFLLFPQFKELPKAAIHDIGEGKGVSVRMVIEHGNKKVYVAPSEVEFSRQKKQPTALTSRFVDEEGNTINSSELLVVPVERGVNNLMVTLERTSVRSIDTIPRRVKDAGF